MVQHHHPAVGLGQFMPRAYIEARSREGIHHAMGRALELRLGADPARQITSISASALRQLSE